MSKRRYAYIFLIYLWFVSGCLDTGAKRENTALDENLALAWKYQAEGAINQTPLIVADLVIVAPSGGPLLVLDLDTGRERWRFAPTQGLWERAFASDGKRVFIGLKDKSLVALNAANGKLLWQKELGINMQVPPLVSDGVLYAPTTFIGPELTSDADGRAKVFALDTITGKELWTFETDNYILQTPARNDGFLFVGGSFYNPAPVDEGGHVRIYALDAKDGSPRWTYESEDGFFKRLYATGRMLVFVGYQDFLNGVDVASGKLQWRYDTGNWTPSLLGAGNVVYFGSANTKVFALDANTGEALWQFDIPEGTFNYLLGAPVKIDKILYFLTQQGGIFALNAESGELLWQVQTEISAARTGLAVGNDWLIVGDIDGMICAYK